MVSETTPFVVKGKTAIVTGAGSGINLCFAALLLSRGCNVVFADLGLRPEAQAIADQYSQKSTGQPRAIFQRTDVTDWTQLSRMFEVAQEEFGGVDLVCPGAGVFEPNWSNFWNPPGTAESKDSIDGGRYASLDINLTHPIRVSQLAIQIFLSQQPRASPQNPKRIVMISSVAGEGIIKTPLWTDNPDKMKYFDETKDLWATPEEVAETLLTLVENEDMVGGTILEVGHEVTRNVPMFNNPGPKGAALATIAMAAARELEDYLETGRYKDGLSKCNKLLKKSPANNQLLYFKANFLFSMMQTDEGNQILDQLCSRNPPIVDLTLISDLDELATMAIVDDYPRALSNGPRAGKLWTNATNSAGKNGVIAINQKRFTIAVSEQRWQDAATALIAMKKADPLNRRYKLAHIAVQQLLSEADKDEKVAGMNRILAFRTLKQMPVEDSAQLRLMMNLYRRQGQKKDMIEALDSFKDKPDDKLAKQIMSDWPFTRQKIQLYIAESRWQEVLDLCSSLLDENSPDGTLKVRDDWVVWDGLVRAAAKLGKPDVTPAVTEKDDWRIKRLQMMANVQATVLSEAETDTRTKSQETLQSAKEFFTEWQSYPFCYGDIREFVDDLPSEAQQEFLDHVSQTSMKLTNSDAAKKSTKASDLLNSEINALKFQYRINIGITKPKADVIKNFACECIRLMETSSQSKLLLSDACYLAVSALIRLYELESDITYLFQAAYLLETGPVTEDAHPGKVLLVYLETELGLHSLAMKQYASLRVREIQQETMAHSLLTRISVNHPFALDQRGEASVDPYEIIDNALDMFFATDKKLAHSQSSLLKQGQCDLVFELQELRDTLEHSFTRRMLILEQCRMARLTDNPFHPRTPDIRPSIFEGWTQDLKDSRDYAETFNFDGVGTESTPERRLHSAGKIPNVNWISQAIVNEDVWALLSSRPTVCAKSSCVTEEEAAAFAAAGANELTPTEKALAKPWAQLLQATKSLLGTNEIKPDAGLLDRLAKSTQELSTSDILGIQKASGLPPSSYTLQPYFLLLDFIRSAAFFCNVATDVEKKKRQGNRLPPQPVQRIRDAVAKHFVALQTLAREQKAKIDGRDMVQALREGTTGDAMAEAAFLSQGIRTFATKAEASALDAWEGVLKVRLGLK
ncbi:hypothetical protein E4T38_08217 [Aureobasidium subglaciale]|nr:hypothetical protein E4T38_08217 [Aureobasidium subglaciale]KAI5215678.1 hypothetical protein E4T40_08227 [Aureobasidium subglaciale]KAI5218862.1 hypothetical protein E4T41_08142 [Aureobasidium subglaciale]KAI5256534.1 hypothetical protein E4T46_08118 [Aureobasidium subglaciale]